MKAHEKLDGRLEGRDFICGDYSIIDIAAIGSTVPLLLHGVEDVSVYTRIWLALVRSGEAPSAAGPARTRGRQQRRASNLPDYYAAALFDDGWNAEV